jgi:hypothetical protein
MKKDSKQDYIIKVGNPPPKQSSVLTAKGGHKPAKDDRVKFSYTDEPPAKPKKHTKLKSIIFGESMYEDNLDEFVNVVDFGKALASTLFGVGFDSLGDFSKHVDLRLATKDIERVNEILKKKLTLAEKYLIENNLMSEASIREYRRLITLYTVFSDKTETSKILSPELRPGAFEALQVIAEKLFGQNGLDQKYLELIDQAEEELNLPSGEGRFEPYLRTYRFSRAYSPSRYGRRRKTSVSSRDDKAPQRGTVTITPEEKEAARKERLLTVLDSYVGKNGMLFQVQEFLEKLIDFVPPTEAGLKSDYNRRLNSVNLYIDELEDIDRDLDTNELRAILNKSLSKIRPAMTRARILKRYVKDKYSSDPGFPKEILNIPFIWTNPETGAKLTGEEKVD